MYIQGLFGSDRSPRRGDLVRACVRPCVLHFPQKNTANEFLKHSKESRGVLVQAGKQAGKQASNEASMQAST